jgi:hypothetical protein
MNIPTIERSRTSLMPATILLQTKLVLPYSHKKPAIAMEYSYLDYCSG